MTIRQHSWFAVLALALVWPLHAVGDEADSPLRQEASAAVRDAYRTVAKTGYCKLPIGVFDSGTGGLAVLEKVLNMDAYDNQSQRPIEGGDGKADFAGESFVFLADQANMPYGNYAAAGKQRYLEDLIVKDAEFLLTPRRIAETNLGKRSNPNTGKPIKAILIACNTATAYGMDDIQDLIASCGLDIAVIGVIDAGAEGAVNVFQDGEAGTVGVLATSGTVDSGAYPRSIRKQIQRQNLSQRIDIIQQGGWGWADAIDGTHEFISADASHPRAEYQGPSLDNPRAKIEVDLLGRYDFDFSEDYMLFSGPRRQLTAIQLNSVENYVAYHVVTLMEKLRQASDPQPLRAIVLGCTHYPFCTAAIRAELRRLYDYREDGVYVYRRVMSRRIMLVDPAEAAARQLYHALADCDRLVRVLASGASQASDGPANGGAPFWGAFYITTPKQDTPQEHLNDGGSFTYEYKYGRSRESIGSDYHAVPLLPEHMNASTQQRLDQQLPAVWQLYKQSCSVSPLAPVSPETIQTDFGKVDVSH